MKKTKPSGLMLRTLSKRLLKLFAYAAMIIMLVIAWQALSLIAYHYLWLDQDLAQLENDYGVRLRADYPPDWLNDDTGQLKIVITDGGEPVEVTTKIAFTDEGIDFARFVRILKPEIERYSPALIRQHLTDIYYLDTLGGGAAAVGTYSREQSSLYLANKSSSTTLPRLPLQIKQTFHHEFSSILMYDYAFDQQVWRQAADEGFRYQQDNDLSFLWTFSDRLDEAPSPEVLFKRGLLRFYAETGVENDFNIYAGIIFTEPQRMKTLIATYPVIARKYAVFKTFYLGIDPGLAPVFAAIED